MATADKKYLDNNGLIKIFENLDEQLNEIPLKKLLDFTKLAYRLFYQYEGTSIYNLIQYNDTSNVTNMGDMFYGCSNLTTVPSLNTSNVTDMSYMFRNCTNLTSIPLLNTSNVTDMSFMFDYCTNLTTVPSLNTSNVTDMSYMFRNCTNLTKISMLNIGADLDISSCTKMEKEAIVEVLNNLKDLSGQTSKTLTLGSTLLVKLTTTDKLIATNKNWVLS